VATVVASSTTSFHSGLATRVSKRRLLIWVPTPDRRFAASAISVWPLADPLLDWELLT
jgi:hypothetical protein